MSTRGLVEHFFRHEYGRLVATLSLRVGVQHIEAVEDAVQSALMRALESWTVAGLPDNPSAWLFRVANNALVGELRQRTRRRRILEQATAKDCGRPKEGPEPFLAGEVPDDLLRMLFVCCDEAIPVESQLVLALKTLCGFDVREIALRLFTSGANVYKRLGRARSRLRALPPRTDELTGEQYASRLPSVHKILYLMFTEGYLASHTETAIRRELCDEAIRLASILAECYSLLEQVAPSPVHKLNRAVAVAEWQGPAAGLAVLEGAAPPTWLAGSYMWAAVLADLHRRCGHDRRASCYRALAYEAAPPPAVKKLLQRRLKIGSPS